MSGAIIHEWIEATGGAEKVVDSFVEMMPTLPLLCLWNDAPDRFPAADVKESILARTPLRKSKAAALPLMPAVWRSWKNDNVEWALISSHLFAHHLRFRGRAEIDRFIYVHTPARYLWTPELDARGASPLVRMAAPALRSLDRRRAQEGGNFAANSNFVARRIEDFWGVEATTIYPPVDVDRIKESREVDHAWTEAEKDILQSLPSQFLFCASRMVPYKRMDAAITAGSLSNTPVVIAGDGPDRARLEHIAEDANVSVIFVGRVSDEMLYLLYQRCSAFIFVGVEDFGIVPVEAMAAGAPVVGNRIGGVAETVVDGETGALCNPDDPADFRDAVERAVNCSSVATRSRAELFSAENFKENIKSWVGADRINSANRVDSRAA
ncbi:glycosyltransferase [Rhodococcus rhodochrous]|uniref:glycosyltransferase n=1 Tax=Rhodococcus rhodochrous TaxID=1829 RepID=UPI0009B99E6B|nr:glycosyltransferase [Rhodococcus rhodochrous]MBF4478308.1 glycosyltransferase [Rhodococcus rhodochrous]MDO1486875.1 glycosyltransferase [Rhodococcus rhodochrous]SNV24882.1 glycosyltransferase [Rhodococcus rhodochrous]